MNLYYLSLLTLFISIYAADLPDKLRLVIPQEAANVERCAPEMHHIIEFQKRETLTKKTFAELFNNAHQHNVPWPFAIVTVDHSTAEKIFPLLWDYIDIIELLRSRTTAKMLDHCLSGQVVDKLTKKGIKELFTNLYPEFITITPDPRILILQNNTFTFLQPLGYHLDDKHEIHHNYSDISCAANILLYNNYNELLPIIKMSEVMATHISDSQIYQYVQYMNKFWNNVFYELPQEKQHELMKEFKIHFGKANQ